MYVLINVILFYGISFNISIEYVATYDFTEGPDNAIEGSDKKIKGPAHGDELAYLFEPLDDEGKSVGGPISEMDARVRDSFVDLIAKFAHRKPENKNTKNITNIFGFLPFSSDGEQYIKITDKITLDKNFRYVKYHLQVFTIAVVYIIFLLLPMYN